MTEQPMSGGAAFWAARGVRIEPEVVDEEEFEAEAGGSEDEQAEVAVEVEAGGSENEYPELAVAVEGPDDEQAEVAEQQVEEAAELAAEPEAVGAEREADDVPEPEDTPEPEPEIVPESKVVPEPEDVPESDAEPEVIPEPRVAEATSLPGFPQQRSEQSSPAVSVTDSDSVSARASDPESDAEPAWQLSGDLASPLPPLKTCIEAILMVVDEPVSVVLLAQVLERPTAEVAEALKELAEEYTVLGRGFELREVGVGSEGERTGWRVYSRAECAAVVERFVRDGQQAKLTQAALETLAVVAYRQPVSRSKVSAIRGVNCDGVMRTLLARGLVEEYGNDHETGAILYQTTGFFLERMGLKSLDELPDLAPLLPSAAEVDVEDFA
ncbi:MAG TPA: SMC-Scp complex subunit ScpB [Actinospica sp.]|nr:SMC-Scp complex subunit ScpB [Actinospica sp.]